MTVQLSVDYLNNAVKHVITHPFNRHPLKRKQKVF